MTLFYKEYGKETAPLMLFIHGGGVSSWMWENQIIVAANPNCTGVIISNVGHGAPLAIPNVFNDMLENWIIGNELPSECKTLTKG